MRGRRKHRRAAALIVIAMASVSLFVAYYAWDYRSQTLVDQTTTIRESYSGNFGLDTTFGNRTVQIAVETLNFPVYVSFWWLRGLNAGEYWVYFGHQLVQVNSTWTTSVSVHDSGGSYSLIVAKDESYGETALTTIQVKVTV